MIDDEELEFQLDTSTGLRDVVMSKSSLARLAGSFNAAPETIVRSHAAEIRAIVERKIAKGRVTDGQIRIHGTDL